VTIRSTLLPLAALAAAALGGCGGSDATDLAFVSSRDGVYSIYVMGADGGGERRLTEDEATTPETPTGLFFEIEPAWSPDGARVAFASKRRGNFDVYVTGADGKGTRRLTGARADETHPTWSPDGEEIAFQRGNPADLYVKGPGAARRLTDGPNSEVDPAWSPDGRWIAYQLRRPGTPLAEIWLVRRDGTGNHRLTALERSAQPAWSPDSGRVAFATTAGSRSDFDIYTVGVDGQGLRRITSSPEDEFEPAFSPDGASIAFERGGAIVVSDTGSGVHTLTDGANNDGSAAWRPKAGTD
jgi:dipeptidyl aminopeptidase/acylaminoacyl peptidase